jgi:energy-coupling factor transport system permease protein
LVWALCGGLVAASTTNPFYLLPLFAAAWAVHAARCVELPTARSFRIFVIFGALTILTRTALVIFTPGGVAEITKEIVAAAFLEGLRLAVLLAVFGAFNSVSDPFGILRLSPRRFHEPALAAALSLSIAPRTIAAVHQVREAQRIRGFEVTRWRSFPALVVPVMETGMEEAVTLAESMDARGHGRGARSRYRRERFGSTAAATCLVALVSMIVFWSARTWESGDVSVSTSPLQWPEASILLVAAALSFALPALLPREDPR